MLASLGFRKILAIQVQSRSKSKLNSNIKPLRFPFLLLSHSTCLPSSKTKKEHITEETHFVRSKRTIVQNIKNIWFCTLRISLFWVREGVVLAVSEVLLGVPLQIYFH